MAKININNKLLLNGKLTFNRKLNEDGKSVTITGLLLTHLYFDEINSIETERYILNNVNVYQESFGSDDYNIGYLFNCSDLQIKGVESDGAKFILFPEEMKKIEDEMYKDDHPILGDIGKQYKDVITENVQNKEGE